MVRRNVEIELQSLLLLQHKLGLIDTTAGLKMETDDEKIMSIIINKSKEEYDAIYKATKGGIEANRGHVHSSMTSREDDNEVAYTIAKKSSIIIDNLKNELDQNDFEKRQMMKSELAFSDDTTQKLHDLHINKRPPSSHKVILNNKNSDSSPNSPKLGLKKEPTLSEIYLGGKHVDSNELERRADFMKQQRDILTENKRLERQKELDKFVNNQSESGGQPQRPMSSKAARNYLSSGSNSLNTSKSSDSEEMKRAEARRALADTLKREVINTKSFKY
jgi:hypothetical protein